MTGSARTPSHREEHLRSPGARLVVKNAFWTGAIFTTVAAPWMLGGHPLSTQWWLLAGALLTFVAGAAVRGMSPSTSGSRRAWRVQRAALVVGLAFLGFIYLQARNPSLRVHFSGNLWTLSQLPAAPGPHSIDAPFDDLRGDWLPYKNAWRYLLIFGTAWLFAAGLALGLVERSGAVRWMRLVAANTGALALVCLIHRVSGAKRTLWHYADTFDFTGSPIFFYKNHNGAYLAASMAIVLAVAAAAGTRSHRRVWELVALLTWAATVAVNSRVATACATLWGILYLVWRWRQARAAGDRVLTRSRIVIAGCVAAAAIALVVAAGGGRALGRFAPALHSPMDFLQGGGFRAITREVGVEMWKDAPVWGWGGGAYMYLFNSYHPRVPAVAQWVYREQPNLNRFVAPGLNCDWIEFLVEYGAAGVALLAAAFVIAVSACWRWRREAPAGAFFLMLAAAGLVGHAYFDYVLRNLAIVLLFLGTLVVAVRVSTPGRRGAAGEQAAVRSVNRDEAAP